MNKRSLGDNFGDYLTYNESLKSQTATRKGIINIPKEEEYQNMVKVYDNIYLPLVEHFHRKIPVSSFYRSELLNKAVGGSKTSDHCFGRAIDLDADDMGIGLTNKMIFDYVKANLKFKQLIYEGYNSETNSPEWVHISFDPNNNKKEILRMEKINGKTIYTNI